MSGHGPSFGRIVGRREALAMLGAGACLASPFATALAADAGTSSSCVATPEQTEGPFFVDERLNRADIRADPVSGTVKDGVPLALRLVVHRVSAQDCAPLAGAIVDVWHCDALGSYSDVNGSGARTAGQKFLRGYQITDAQGGVQFATIYPGWYPGRTAHIHFKVRGETPSRGRYAFTSQLYFDDAMSDRVYVRAPYAEAGKRSIGNRGDYLYRSSGQALTVALRESGPGFDGRFDIGLRLA